MTAMALRRSLVVGTRSSRLALAQTHIVVDLLRALHPDLSLAVGVRSMTTEGDRTQAHNLPLQDVAGRGVFVKELEQALIDGSIDLAVHSLKDMTAEPDPALAIAAIPPREDPRDVLVTRDGGNFAALPAGARVGTSSPRRAAQLSALRPDLRFDPIRGNVDTRVRKVDDGEYDAVILAAAGLSRLGLSPRIAEYFSPDICLPDPGQGALAVQVRSSDAPLRDLLAPLDDPLTRAAVTAERSFLRSLGGGCRIPVGALASVEGAVLTLQGAVAAVTDSRILRAALNGLTSHPEQLGVALAAHLRMQGADGLLDRG